MVEREVNIDELCAGQPRPGSHMKLTNPLAEKILGEYVAAASTAEARLVAKNWLTTHSPGATIHFSSSKRFDHLRKRSWCNAGLVLLVDDAAPDAPDLDLPTYFERLPKGCYGNWSGWDKDKNFKHLKFNVSSDAGCLESTWESRLSPDSSQHVGYPTHGLFCLAFSQSPEQLQATSAFVE